MDQCFHSLERKLLDFKIYKILYPAILVLSSFNDKGYCWVLVAHACNPSYSGGRVQEDRGSKPAVASSLRESILKIPNTR
jgi:hypothetical protein